MAVLYITEYASVGQINGSIPLAAEPANTSQTVAISGSSAASSAFAGTTAVIRIHTDAICSITLGTAPTATTSKPRMAANQTEYFTVPVGAAYKVAVISNT